MQESLRNESENKDNRIEQKQWLFTVKIKISLLLRAGRAWVFDRYPLFWQMRSNGSQLVIVPFAGMFRVFHFAFRLQEKYRRLKKSLPNLKKRQRSRSHFLVFLIRSQRMKTQISQMVTSLWKLNYRRFLFIWSFFWACRRRNCLTGVIHNWKKKNVSKWASEMLLMTKKL